MNLPYQNQQINPDDKSYIQAGQIPRPLIGRTATDSYWDNDVNGKGNFGNGTFIAEGPNWTNDWPKKFTPGTLNPPFNGKTSLGVPGSSSGVNSKWYDLESGFALVIAPYEPDNFQYGKNVYDFTNTGQIANSGVLAFSGVELNDKSNKTSIFTNTGNIINSASLQDSNSTIYQFGGTFNNYGLIQGWYTAGTEKQDLSDLRNNYNFEWGTFNNGNMGKQGGNMTLDFYEYVTIGKYLNSIGILPPGPRQKWQTMEFNHNKGTMTLQRPTDPANEKPQQANISILDNGIFNLRSQFTNDMSGYVLNNWGVFNGSKNGKGKWTQTQGIAKIRNAQGYANKFISDSVQGSITGTHHFTVNSAPGTDSGVQIYNDAIMSPGSSNPDDKIGVISIDGGVGKASQLESTINSTFEFDILGKSVDNYDTITIKDGDLILDQKAKKSPTLKLTIADDLTLGKGDKIDLFKVIDGGKIEGSFLPNFVTGLPKEIKLQQDAKTISLVANNVQANTKPPAGSSVLFGALADSGRVKQRKNGSYRMVLEGVDEIDWFTDRPEREAGSWKPQKLLKKWDSMFSLAEPNAQATFLIDGDRELVTFEMFKPRINKAGDALIFRAKGIGKNNEDKITGLKGKTIDDISLFIDDAMTLEGRLPDGMQTPGRVPDCFPDCEGANLMYFNDGLMNDINLAGGNFAGATLEAVVFNGANLKNANFSNADLNDAGMQEAKLAGANLSGANLSAARLWGSNLQNANLEGANLYLSDLQNTGLDGANLANANLIDTNISYSDLEGANFTGAKINAAMTNTICPDGTKNIDNYACTAEQLLLT